MFGTSRLSHRARGHRATDKAAQIWEAAGQTRGTLAKFEEVACSQAEQWMVGWASVVEKRLAECVFRLLNRAEIKLLVRESLI